MSGNSRKPLPGRRNRTETLGTSVSRLTKQVYGRRGLADGAIAREWTSIVGELIARHCQPDRISYANRQRTDGLLHLRIDNSAMATELQHLEPQLLERVNGYFGYKAVARLRFIHGPMVKDQDNDIVAARPPTAPPPADPAVAASVASIDDPELRDALEKLGNAVTHTRKTR